jgi:hypothetical protein
MIAAVGKEVSFFPVAPITCLHHRADDLSSRGNIGATLENLSI